MSDNANWKAIIDALDNASGEELKELTKGDLAKLEALLHHWQALAAQARQDGRGLTLV